MVLTIPNKPLLSVLLPKSTIEKRFQSHRDRYCIVVLLLGFVFVCILYCLLSWLLCVVSQVVEPTCRFCLFVTFVRDDVV